MFLRRPQFMEDDVLLGIKVIVKRGVQYFHLLRWEISAKAFVLTIQSSNRNKNI